ncbi:glycosyltransferase family 2 protein [Rhodocytophaga rosea]|uniref:Glycosyltransferase family 2 protein n=1 Tax=Rhodocytophaga rosea TaxID=2704465 RepID=A0A6C0GQM1_9BACT|nr:glycosyltransferase family 2 protein [Rhodocytophaga rosea]QHT69800.1 glycosyltransferase family 2 protein [Rhodocytophaga rosea]
MLYIIIPVFNRKKFTEECLLSLQKQTNTNFKIIVVDDGSTDGTSEMIDKNFSEVILIKAKGDLFWTAATNLGISYALNQHATFVMTLNNDTIATEDFVEKMYYWAAKKPDIIMGALALDAYTKEPVFGGERLNWLSNTNASVLANLSPEKQTGLHQVTHFPGRGLWIPRKVFEKIGLFDVKKFPHYFADYDFTYTATRAGFEIYCNFDAKIFIYPSESGDHQIRKKKTIKNYYNHLFGIKGGGNLANFTKFTLKNCPTPYIPLVLLNGYFRRIFGYIIK